MVDVSSQNNSVSINVSSSGNSASINATPDMAMYYSEKSREWAISNRIVDGVDYSSKYYANKAEESASNAQGFESAIRDVYNGFLGETTEAIENVQGARDEAIANIETSRVEAIDSINSTKTTILNDIEFVADGEKKEIEDLADEIKDNGDTVNTAIEAGVERLNSIDALKKSQITNCLLEVPQRIKYDLTDGVLTIKKGSQVIVPYGTSGGNFTVAGSPTITDDGVASGFNNSFADCISTAGIRAENLRNKSWEITASIIVPGDLKLQTNIFNIGKTYHYFGSVSVLRDAVCFFARTGTMSDTNNEGTKIKIGKSATVTHIGVKLEYVLSTGTYKLTVYDLQNNTKLGEGAWTAPSEGRTNTQLVGVNSGGEIIIGSVADSNTYMGVGQIIDLKQFSITVDDEVVYRPYLQKGDRFLNDNFKVADTQYEDGKFFVWAEVQNDMQGTANVSTKAYIEIRVNADNLMFRGLSDNTFNYDTTKNLAIDTDETTSVFCFPLGICTITTDGVSVIDQIFNGMGYIGSTIWVDKGVKVLIPNGRNEDGSLRNIESTLTKVCVTTDTRVVTSGKLVLTPSSITNGGAHCVVASGYTYSEEEPTTARWYKPSANMYYIKRDGVWNEDKQVHIGDFSKTATSFTSFQPKQPFRAIDCSDKSDISGWSMPSNKYITLTFGASGTTYTAPANGWLTVDITATALRVDTSKKMFGGSASDKGSINTRWSVELCKGDTFTVRYSAVSTVGTFAFIYAQGEV
jgi:hypothetical protein